MVMENKTDSTADIIMLLDASGSMRKIKDSVIAGYNSFIREQKKIKGNAFLTTILFGGKILPVHNRINIRYARPLTGEEYKPGGGTLFLDAMGMAIRQADSSASPRTLIAIITDGFENSSSQYSYAGVKDLVELRRAERRIKFFLFGLNISATFEAARIGIPAEVISCKPGEALDFSAPCRLIEKFRNGE